MKTIIFKKYHIRRIEALGLTLILISFGWQMFETDLGKLSKEYDYYEIHSKLSAIWDAASYHYHETNPSESTKNKALDIKSLENSWKPWGQVLDSKESIIKQAKIATYIKITLYVIGSILVIISKFNKNIPDSN